MINKILSLYYKIIFKTWENIVDYLIQKYNYLIL